MREPDVEETGQADAAHEIDERPERTQSRSSSARATGEVPTSDSSRVSLLNSVAQEVRQNTPEGVETSRSQLDLAVTLRLEESVPRERGASRDDSRERGQRYQIRFDRVRLTEELAGEPATHYDSESSASRAPQGSEPYQGLSGNSFEFWLDRKRQLLEVIGFEPFLDRCLGHVSQQDRDRLRAALQRGAPGEALTAFVGEGIGLIPPEIAQAGDSWVRTRQAAQPIPYQLTTRYILTQVTSEFIDVESTGTFSPPASTGRGDEAPIAIFVRDGRLKGETRIDRRSGLPIRSRVEQTLNMTVRLADGSEFDQEKLTVSTLEPRR